MHVSSTVHGLRMACALTGIAAIAACGAGTAATHPSAIARTRHSSSGSSSGPAVTRVTTPKSAAPAAPAAPAPPPPPPAPPRVSISRVLAADGSVVTVAVFSGPVRYVLHDGSQDPAAPAAGLVKAGPAVGGTERRQLLAAFNGGFKMNAGAGGYEQEGHVFSPLRNGFASLVIDRSGQARIGVWGHGTPAPGESVYSVRQNLQPLILGGNPTAAAYQWGLWGATLGGGSYVARSALGQDAAGNLMYAASMSAVPIDLAQVLASKGARIAMELDINPAWVQLDATSKPGGSLHAEVYGQNRPADQFLAGWTRDFITVVAAPATAPAAPPPLRVGHP